MKFHIRNAGINDAKTLGCIHSISFRTAYKGIIPDAVLDNFTAERREEYFRKSLANGTEENVLIIKNNEPAGFMCLGKCRDEDLDNSFGEIWGIYLLPAYWNQGLGKELINWGIRELSRRGYKRVSLWVLEDNINARKFYDKLGFKHDAKIKKVNIGKPLNELRYTRSISSIIIRKIVEQDVESVSGLMARNFNKVLSQYHSKHIVEKFKSHNTPDKIRNQMVWKEIFVVEDDGEVVATGALANFGDAENPKYSVSNFFVKPEYHKRGIGRCLFGKILESAKERKAELLHVPSSRNAIGFYEKMGFVKNEIQNDIEDEITWMTMMVKLDSSK